MKYLQIIVCLTIASCVSTEKTDKANKIINAALDFSVRHEFITREDAESAKEVNNIVLPTVIIETTSSK